MRISAGSILARSLAVLAAHLGPFLLLALLVFAPVLAVSLIVGAGGALPAAHPGATEVEPVAASPLGAQFVVGILAFMAQYLLAGAVAWGVAANRAGRRPAAREIVRRGLAQLVAVADTAFVTGILVGIGFFLLVVPGIFAGAVLFVAVPAAAARRFGPGRALAESAALTRGRRGDVAGAVLPLAGVLFATVGLLFAVGLVLPWALAPFGRVAGLLAATAAQLFFGAYAGVCQNVAYGLLLEAEDPVAATPEALLEALDRRPPGL